MSAIVDKNQLTSHDGIYKLPGEEADFAYSDGQESERYLAHVFSQVEDLGSASASLQEKIIDWPSEYHFTHKRANLLRGLDLSQCKNVLELGSGCGAISRYLGEQGLQVDAIEGSAKRAKLGRMRCHDLPNVRIINANYNDLEIPKKEYDLVLFVGVIEYASMFYPEAQNDYQAALQILSHARSWLAPGGVVLVAIENRLGLKYILGHHEDHYHKRYIGIDGYQDSVGMATYSRQEWQKLSQEVGFSELKCLLPFPDYKIPEVVLSESYVQSNMRAFNHLEGVFARDYSGVTDRLVTEPIALQAANQGGFLPQIANSFCLLLGDDVSAINRIGNLDFYHGPVLSRKAQYVVDTLKLADQDRVIKRKLFAPVKQTQSEVSQQLPEQNFIQGDLLSTRWLRSILVYNDLQPINAHLQSYYQFLQQRQASSELAIDMLPNNIIVDDNNDWQVFDQEWQVDIKLDSQFVLFRALLNFITRNWYLIRGFLAACQFNTVKDFVRHGFAVNGLILEDYITQCMRQEAHFQDLIGHKTSLDELLLQQLEHKQEAFANENLRLLGDDGKVLDMQQSYRPSPEKHVLRFAFENHAIKLTALEFSPFDLRYAGDLGFFAIEKIQLLLQQDDQENSVWQLSGEEIAAQAKSDNLIYNRDEKFWIAQNVYPKLHFDLTQNPLAFSADQQCYIEVHLMHHCSDYYSAAKNQFIAANKTLMTENQQLRQQVKDEARMRQTLQIEVDSQRMALEQYRDNFFVKIARKTVKTLGLKK